MSDGHADDEQTAQTTPAKFGERKRPDTAYVAPALEPGMIVGKWEVCAFVASGGFARVYRARESSTGQIAALKVLKPEMATDAQIMGRFEREVELVSTLEHPSIVKVIDVGATDDQRPYFAMELLDGVTLSEYIAMCGRLSLSETLEIVKPLCEALAEAHVRGIIHRDVKASNVILCEGEGVRRVMLLDFGIAKPLDAASLTESREVIGTPSAMAPEQVARGTVDPRTDVYLVGLLVFHMLTGHKPFPADTASRAWELLNTRRPSLSDFVAIDPAIEYVVACAMSYEKADRYDTARELWDALALAGKRGIESRTTRAAAAYIEVRLPEDLAADPPEELLDRMDDVLSAAERLAEQHQLDVELSSQSSLMILHRDSDGRELLDVARKLRAHVDSRAPYLQVNMCLHVDAVSSDDTGRLDPASPILCATKWAPSTPVDGIAVTPQFSELAGGIGKPIEGLDLLRVDGETE